jgi:hypothetical protein
MVSGITKQTDLVRSGINKTTLKMLHVDGLLTLAQYPCVATGQKMINNYYEKINKDPT